jgi:hypothetical protein
MHFDCMSFHALRIGSLSVTAVLFIAGIPFPAQSGTSPGDPKEVTENEAKIYGEAMEWFKKAAAMIGTSQE